MSPFGPETFGVFLAAVMPGAFLLWMANTRGSHRENWRHVVVAFLLGILTIGPVAFAVGILREIALAFENPIAQAFSKAFLTAALPEESVKLLATLLLLRVTRPLRHPLAPVIHATGIALGFATFENLIYVSEEGASTAAIRALTAIPCHGALGVLMGAYLAEAFYTGSKKAAVKAWLFPVVLHGLYNFPLMATYGGFLVDQGKGALSLTMLTLLLLAVWARMIYLRFSRLTPTSLS